MEADQPTDEAWPEPGPRDQMRRAVETAVAAVPGLGGVGTELLRWILPSSLEKRRQRWFELLADRLAAVERGRLDNEALVTFVIEASKAALGTHLEEKLRLLANCVASEVGSADPGSFAAMRLLGHVEALAPEHFRVLAILSDQRDDPKLRRWFNSGNPERLVELSDGRLLVEDVLPAVRDLEGRYLVQAVLKADPLTTIREPRVSRLLGAVYEPKKRRPGGAAAMITPEGQELLRFVQLMVEDES